jgi:hypothetical protein
MKMFDYKIDTTLLPAMWITWASTKGGKFNERHWLNCKTGKKKTAPEKWMHYPNENTFDNFRYNTKGAIGIYWWNRNEDKFWVKSGVTVRLAYVKYHKREDVLEVAVVGIDTTRKVEPHPWKYLGDRYFIRRDKTIVNQYGNTCSSYHMYEYHDAWNPNIMFSMLCRLIYNDHAVDEFKKFIGQDFFTIGNGRSIDITDLCHLQEWYKTKQRLTPCKGAAQQMVDTLTSMPLCDISDKIKPHFDNPNRRRYKAVCFERIDDEWSVLRIFKNDNIEHHRMYLSDSGKLRYAMYNSNNGWVACNAPTYKYNYSYLVNKDEAMDSCKRIKYAIEALEDVSDCYLINCMFSVLKMPELEQLAKMGGKNIVKNAVMATYPKAHLRHWAGEYYNEKEKNILRKIGLNKSQLDCYIKKRNNAGYYGSYYEKALEKIRKQFGNDLNHIDITSFEKYLEGFYQISRHFWRNLEDSAIRLDFEYKRFIKNLMRLGEKNTQTYQLVNDTINTALCLNQGTMPEIDWYFDDYSDIVRIHDAMVELKRIQDAERRYYWSISERERMQKDEEKRQKIDKERQQYEYEDEAYVIRLPKDLTEIVNEGAKQSICIGGYTGRHANGQTNLFFLREKSNPDKPFYAIEMGNDKHIVQIHGFGNAWLGNHPDAIPTVIRWLRKNGISCSDQILTCTAKGYCSVNSYVPMPIVD